jgi:hypothetical protein
MLSDFFSIFFMIFAARKFEYILQPKGPAKKRGLSMQDLMEISADPSVNLNPTQCNRVIMCRLSAVVFSRWLYGNQSGQTTQIKLTPQEVRYLMTICIPREMPTIVEREIPQITSSDMRQLLESSSPNSVIIDQSGAKWISKPSFESSSPNSVIIDQSGAKPSIMHQNFYWSVMYMTTHKCLPFALMIDCRGKVWITRTDQPKHFFSLIHDGNYNAGSNATTCSFHCESQIIAIAIRGYMVIYSFSAYFESMVCMQRVSFGECTLHHCYRFPLLTSFSECSPQVSEISEIQWDPKKTSFIAISHRTPHGFAMMIDLDNDNLSVIGKKKCADVGSIRPGSTLERPALHCSFFLPDGALVVTGHSKGLLFFWETDTFHFKGAIKALDDSFTIDKITVCSGDHRLVALKATSDISRQVVLFKISPDFSSSEILQTFHNAKDFQFHRNLFLLRYNKSIAIYFLMSNNRLIKVFDFQLRIGMATIQSCFLTTANGVTLLHYSHDGSTVHHIALLN